MADRAVPSPVEESALAEEARWGRVRRTPFDLKRHSIGLTVATAGLAVWYSVSRDPLPAGIAGLVVFPWSLYVVVRGAVEGAVGARLDGIGNELARLRARGEEPPRSAGPTT